MILFLDCTVQQFEATKRSFTPTYMYVHVVEGRRRSKEKVQ